MRRRRATVRCRWRARGDRSSGQRGTSRRRPRVRLPHARAARAAGAVPPRLPGHRPHLAAPAAPRSPSAGYRAVAPFMPWLRADVACRPTGCTRPGRWPLDANAAPRGARRRRRRRHHRSRLGRGRDVRRRRHEPDRWRTGRRRWPSRPGGAVAGGVRRRTSISCSAAGTCSSSSTRWPTCIVPAQRLRLHRAAVGALVTRLRRIDVDVAARPRVARRPCATCSAALGYYRADARRRSASIRASTPSQAATSRCRRSRRCTSTAATTAAIGVEVADAARGDDRRRRARHDRGARRLRPLPAPRATRMPSTTRILEFLT